MTRQQRELHDDLSMVREDLGLKVSAIESRIDRLEKRSPSQSLNAETLSPQGDSPAALYEQGLDLIQKKSAFAEGRKLLQDFLKRYPKDPLAVNAQYWVGESYYGEKKYEDAILQFQEVIQQYGDHPKVAAALLKQGLAFKALGDDKNSRLILQKVVDTFPLSDEAKKARERLAEGRGK
jgi:tol-pal system protein YbgF